MYFWHGHIHIGILEDDTSRYMKNVQTYYMYKITYLWLHKYAHTHSTWLYEYTYTH